MSRPVEGRTEPPTVIATYRVAPGREDEFVALLERHYPTLKSVGLVTDAPPVVYRNVDEKGRSTYFEIFEWKDADAPDTAHHLPEVMAVWEAMGTLAEDRDGRPKFEFPHVERLPLSFA
jgi:hypothetical protein